MSHAEGTKLKWNWGSGTATGKVIKVYTRKTTLTIKGTEVTRKADKENPAYRIEQHDGDTVLKSHSEVSTAT